MLTFDYHTHTNFSHGKGAVEENVKQALSLGLKEIAVSEHNQGHVFYGVRGKKLEQLHHTILYLRRKYEGSINVLHGVEANLVGDGITDLQENYREYFFPVLLGYHKGVFPKDSPGLRWSAGHVLGQSKKYAEKNALCVAHALQKHPDIYAVTHPGLYIPMDIKTLAQACADYGAAFELNAGHSGLTLEMVQQAAEVKDLKFLLSSDAHTPQNVGNVQSALEIARAAGVLDRVVNWEA